MRRIEVIKTDKTTNKHTKAEDVSARIQLVQNTKYRCKYEYEYVLVRTMHMKHHKESDPSNIVD